MKPSLWSSYFMELSPEDMVDAFARKGWSCLELSDEHGAVLLERGDPEKTGREFMNYARDKGVSFPQGHLWLLCDIVSENQGEVLDKLKRWADLFLALDIRAAVLHPGGEELGKKCLGLDGLDPLRIKALTVLTEHIRGSGMSYCLENIASSTPDGLIGLVEAAGGRNVAICYDSSHLNLAKGDHAAFIRKAGRRLQALHISDNDGSGDQHLLPYGRGTVPWKEVVSALREIGYEGPFNYEIPGERNCPMPVKLAKLDYARALTDYLLENG